MEINTNNQSWLMSLAMGVLMIILGIYALVNPLGALDLFVIIAGIILLVAGAVGIYMEYKEPVSGNLVMGVVAVVLGIILIACTQFFESLLVYILGAIFAILGALTVLNTFTKTPTMDQHTIVNILIGILLIVLGIIMFVYTSATMKVIMYIIGAFLVISGALTAYDGFRSR